MIYSFAPVIDCDCRVIVLGSMPSVKSLEKSQYYGNKQNYFWPMMFELFGEEFEEDYEAKKALLLRHHVALWDVISSCEREGSLDSRIKEETPNDFRALFSEYPNLQAIVFNGGKAYQSFKRNFPDLLKETEHVQMPSTSPACTIKREEKRLKWQIILSLCQKNQ